MTDTLDSYIQTLNTLAAKAIQEGLGVDVHTIEVSIHEHPAFDAYYCIFQYNTKERQWARLRVNVPYHSTMQDFTRFLAKAIAQKQVELKESNGEEWYARTFSGKNAPRSP
jgi:hypothetical protein